MPEAGARHFAAQPQVPQPQLEVDLRRGGYVFVTGLGPWLRRIEGSREEPIDLSLFRKRMTTRSGVGGEGGADVASRTVETWELRLALPRAEPLFLGEWTERSGAETEIAAWREVFPRLRVVET